MTDTPEPAVVVLEAEPEPAPSPVQSEPRLIDVPYQGEPGPADGEEPFEKPKAKKAK